MSSEILRCPGHRGRRQAAAGVTPFAAQLHAKRSQQALDVDESEDHGALVFSHKQAQESKGSFGLECCGYGCERRI